MLTPVDVAMAPERASVWRVWPCGGLPRAAWAGRATPALRGQVDVRRRRDGVRSQERRRSAPPVVAAAHGRWERGGCPRSRRDAAPSPACPAVVRPTRDGGAAAAPLACAPAGPAA